MLGGRSRLRRSRPIAGSLRLGPRREGQVNAGTHPAVSVSVRKANARQHRARIHSQAREQVHVVEQARARHADRRQDRAGDMAPRDRADQEPRPDLYGVDGIRGAQTQTVEYPTFKHGVGIRVPVDQIEDLDGTGLDQLASWSSQIGTDSAYFPQRLGAQMLLNGSNTDGSAVAYDGIPFFADNSANTINSVSVKGHPFNPFRPALGGSRTGCTAVHRHRTPGPCPSTTR